jgi:2-methylcitrate dehydratase PrpD
MKFHLPRYLNSVKSKAHQILSRHSAEINIMSNKTLASGLSPSQIFADFAASLKNDGISAAARNKASEIVLDISGLCVAARNEDYVKAIATTWDGEGGCTAFGHAQGLDAAGAALINGTAAHGEDYDDTFEGTPVHAGAPVIAATLAACERYNLSGADALRGIVVGCELMCRMALVAQTTVHRAGFHPTAVIGAMGTTAAVSSALSYSAKDLTNALGIAASLASGIIEYLAEGTWTKRMHPGWSAQCGLRAALMGRGGFLGPRTVLEGEHGFYFAFGDPDHEYDFSPITDGLGQEFLMERAAFKPYACGTMTQPFIDCAVKLGREGLDPSKVKSIIAKVGEGTVHRLWEPEAEKQKPSTPYSAKFSGHFCSAIGIIDQAAGLKQFTEERTTDPKVLELASKITYEIDPNDEYPKNYSGHLIVTLDDGSTREVRQPHLRGGVKEPLTREELEAKFRANVLFGGWSDQQADVLQAWCSALFEKPDLADMKDFRA